MKDREQIKLTLFAAAALLVIGLIGWNYLRVQEPEELVITQPKPELEPAPLQEEPVEETKPLPTKKISLISSPREDLMTLPGMTDQIADEIIALRNGVYVLNNDELLAIPGMNREKLDQMIPYIIP